MSNTLLQRLQVAERQVDSLASPVVHYLRKRILENDKNHVAAMSGTATWKKAAETQKVG